MHIQEIMTRDPEACLATDSCAVAADKRWAYPESSTAEQKLGEIVEAIASAR